MKLSDKKYDFMTWLAKFVPLVVTFAGSVLPQLGVGDDTCNIILVIIGAVGAFINGMLEISSTIYNKEVNTND